MAVGVRLELIRLKFIEVLYRGKCRQLVSEIRAVRRGKQKTPSRFQEALQMFEQLGRVRNMFDDFASQHQIKLSSSFRRQIEQVAAEHLYFFRRRILAYGVDQTRLAQIVNRDITSLGGKCGSQPTSSGCYFQDSLRPQSERVMHSQQRTHTTKSAI